ncbi:MAG: hypothetical protein IPJ56_11815 [Gemmatimonadetes bacterium]|nr:hypothetical protein [Gemmatimonadota bacterium]
MRPDEQLRSLREEASSRSISDTLQAGLTALVRAASLGMHGSPTPEASWADWRVQLHEAGSHLQALSERFRDIGLPATLAVERIPELARLLTELRSLAQLITAAPEIRDVLQTHYQGASTDLERVARTITFFDSVSASTVPRHIKDWILDKEVVTRLAHAHRSVGEVVGQLPTLDARWHAFVSLAAVDSAQWFGTSTVADLTILHLVDRASRALSRRDLLAAWLDYLRARGPMVERGLEAMVVLAERREIDADAVGAGLAFVVLNSLVREAFRAHPQLARFSGLSHEQVRKRFVKLDRECIELYRQRAARLTDTKTIPAGVGYGAVRTYTERSLLDHGFQKQRAHIPLRQLMLRAGRALQALKPCFMMGPLSVAQYLTPGALTFDIVVMDEASSSAGGRPRSHSRARQVIIVGDRMQLPRRPSLTESVMRHLSR